MPDIAIIDYGFGNVRSVQRVFSRIGYGAGAVSTRRAILDAAVVVLPGVGAFRDAIGALNRSGMADALRERATMGRPILGICLGMQLLASRSYEQGVHEGLGIIPGEVQPLPVVDLGLRIPHIGWNEVLAEGADEIFDGLVLNRDFYFVHSYHFACTETADSAGRCLYGINFCCAVRRGNVFGLQFHPEKSQDNGRRVLSNILSILRSEKSLARC